ncbi:MAG: chemotaxis protein MotC [Hyphomicrobiales bacterium]
MRIIGITFLAPVLAITLASPADAESGRSAPFELVRSLEALQNQAAAGNASAYAARPKLVAQIAERFQAMDPVIWREPKNARAVATYVLSGGQPAILRKLIGLDILPKQDERLMKGALAYAEGQEAEARELLGDIDAQTLPPSLGGQLALVQSTLLMGADRRKAIALLGLARLLMPGTLVEDVALRREILATGDSGDIDRFLSLSEQYVRRFRHSVYAENFLQGFATSAAKLTPSGGAQALGRLEGLVAMLGVDEQRKVFLSMAETSAIAGNVIMARFSAEHAALLCQEGSAEWARARLYQAAALIVTDDYDKGIEALDSIAKAELPSRDAQLRRAVLALAQQLRQWPQASEPPGGEQPKPEAARETPPAPQSTSSTAVISLAQKEISDVDQLLKGSYP